MNKIKKEIEAIIEKHVKIASDSGENWIVGCDDAAQEILEHCQSDNKPVDVVYTETNSKNVYSERELWRCWEAAKHYFTGQNQPLNFAVWLRTMAIPKEAHDKEDKEAFAEEYALWIISLGQKYINALSPNFTTESSMIIFKRDYYGTDWKNNLYKKNK